MATVLRNFAPILGIVLALLPIACKRTTPGGGQPAAPASRSAGLPPARFIESHNRAVGLMGRFDFEAARELFAQLSHAASDDPDVAVNLAIATLNRQREGDTAKALELIDGVLSTHPDHLRARYCRGILLLHAGKPAEALDDFAAVAAKDPADAYARYHVGQCLLAGNRPADALKQFQEALRIDSRLRSAHYGAFQCLQRTGNPAEAKKQLEEFQRLKDNPQARLVEFKYTRMGAKAEVVAVGARPPLATMPAGPVFADAAPIPISGAAIPPWRAPPAGAAGPSMTACDIDADGQIDLFIAGAFADGSPLCNAVLLRRGEGFILAADHPLAATDGINTVLWGDIDNDGLTDVYFCRRGANQLWRQSAPGRWQDISAASRSAGGDFDTVAGALFDADHDGDLDILLARRNGPTEMLSNNLDGTFRAIGAASGVAGDGRHATGIVVADLDGDRDADIIVLKSDAPHDVLVNDRPWTYVPAGGFEQLSAARGTVVAADADADGQVELYGPDDKGELSRWQPDAAGIWRISPLSAAHAPGRGPLAIADLRGDGDLALVFTTETGRWGCLSLDGGRIPHPVSIPAAWALVNLEPRKGPAIIAIPRAGGAPLAWSPGPGRLSFAALSLTGKHDQAEQMRSNASGIGARIAARIGGRWSARSTYPHLGGAGQSLTPLSVGLAGADKADFISILWPDGLHQTELDVPAANLTLIPETQRQTSSCPVLFAWDGADWSFITDCLGVGGIGFALGPPGQYVPPRPWENLLLPQGLPATRDREYRLKLSEPMEEACYLDTARLIAYDLPPGWFMTLDERMGVNDPQPTGRPVFFRAAAPPAIAINDRGEDVTTALAHADHIAADPGPRDRRFLGFCREHAITMRFDEPIDRGDGDPVLIMDAWVEYPYSQTMFAAWQAGVSYQAPTLEARGADGRWIILLDQFGYPAGMPRQMSVPIPRNRLPAGTRELRLRTNIEVYWDRIALARAAPCPDAQRLELPLKRALLAETGFARRRDFPQRRPGYDYSHRDPLWNAAHQDGFYTALGDVRELLTHVDDAVAIFGPGEEVDLAFAADAPPPPAGCSRRFVLELAGWCKDRDLYTREGDTLTPLPLRRTTAPPDPRRQALHAKYNTRYRAGGAGGG